MRKAHEKSKPQPILTGCALLVLFILMCGARLPFLDNVLLDEEGMFAYLSVNNGDGGKLDVQNGLLIGRVHRQDQWTVPGHPIFPYRVLVEAIRPVNSPDDFSKATMQAQTRAARRPFFLMFVI